MLSSTHKADWNEADRLLSDFWRRIHGAIDMWSLVCYDGLGRADYDCRGFVAHHSQAMREVLASVPAVFSGSDSKEHVIQRLLSALGAACDRFVAAYLVLAKHRELPSEKVRDATETVRATYDEMRSLLGEIESDTGMEISFLRDLRGSTWRESHLQRILDNLDGAFRQARSEPVATP